MSKPQIVHINHTDDGQTFENFYNTYSKITREFRALNKSRRAAGDPPVQWETYLAMRTLNALGVYDNAEDI